MLTCETFVPFFEVLRREVEESWLSAKVLSGSFAPLSTASNSFIAKKNSTGWDLEIHKAVHMGRQTGENEPIHNTLKRRKEEGAVKKF